MSKLNIVYSLFANQLWLKTLHSYVGSTRLDIIEALNTKYTAVKALFSLLPILVVIIMLAAYKRREIYFE